MGIEQSTSEHKLVLVGYLDACIHSCTHTGSRWAKLQEERLQVIKGHLQEMVLDDVSDDPELVEVAPTALSAKGLFHHNLDIGNVLPAPHCRHERVLKPHDDHILHTIPCYFLLALTSAEKELCAGQATGECSCQGHTVGSN